MSKIQDALKRLQSEDRPKSDEDVSRVARISNRAPGTHEHDTEAEVRSDVIIEVDQRALRAEGLIAPGYHERELADQYRAIKRPLIANAFGKRVARVEGGNAIMVTSASPGEGKTFTSINLALSMAQERDHSVLLVDADVAKPHISKVFGLAEEKGLLDLVDDVDRGPESYVINTSVDGLSILPAGLPRDNATELLASDRMERVVSELANRHPGRLVLFDTPPLLDTSEAKVLVDLAGQMVLVVRAEHTPQGAVLEALQLVRDDKAVNLVLNQSRIAPGKVAYGYVPTPRPEYPPKQETEEEPRSLWGA